MSGNIFLLSLGCAKNRVDSEKAAYILESAGYRIVALPEQADTAVINTCGFIRPSVEESIEAILAVIALRDQGEIHRVGVMGCLFNRYGDELKKELPEIDFWVPCEGYDCLLEALGKPVCPERNGRTLLPETSPYTRYLKVIEGCDNHCTYCTIPIIRGNGRSLPIDDLLLEAQNLVESGAKEICLVGQDLTAYGLDLPGKKWLLELVDALEDSLPSSIWLRLLYLHPAGITQALLERVASGKQLLPYLDIPIQHASSQILNRMNRGMDSRTLESIFVLARAIRPDFTLRTTCMLGFPGETKTDFEELMEFLRRVQFDRVGAFTFFSEEGTEAYAMEGQVRENIKRKRLERLMQVQQQISWERQRLFEGQVLPVLVEAVCPEEGTAEGRSFREAPDVDGLIEIRNIKNIFRPGSVIPVRITEALEHDMIGEEADLAT